jgi:DNA-binding NtrC family response regulator
MLSKPKWERILVLADVGARRLAATGNDEEGVLRVCDRAQAAQALDAGGPRAVCLDRRTVEDALADMRWLRRRRNALPVVALVDAQQLGRAVELLQVGVEEIVVRSDGALASVRERLARLAKRSTASPRASAGGASLIARSPAMKACLELVEKAQASDATVLLQGETGTGKEVIARLVHGGGRRAAGPFVGLNCAAFPETLLESELFGHVRGAFTGAERARAGLFAEATGGTLFLDEIGETPPGFQVKLLRALQEGVVRPLGAAQEVQVDARIIAATNRDLAEEVRAGRFRQDLYYRLHVFPIDLPPLRSRVEDIAPLVEHFLARAPVGGPRALARDAAVLLELYPWPGNVRELENEVARIAAQARGETEITARLLSARILGAAETLPASLDSETLRETMARHEAWVLRRALERNGGRRIATARRLGITRECLYKKLKRHGMQ